MNRDMLLMLSIALDKRFLRKLRELFEYLHWPEGC